MAVAPAPAIAPAPAPTRTDLQREYVIGGQSYAVREYGKYARTLPAYIDDVTRDFGDDLYEKMLFDPQVSSCVAVIQTAILETGITLAPAVDDKTNPEYGLAVQIRDEAEAMLGELQHPLTDILRNLLDALSFGHIIAEEVYGPGKGLDGKRRLNLVALKPKDRRMTALVVDPYMNILGVLPTGPDMQVSRYGQTALSEEQVAALLPRERFAILTFRPRYSDPRGTSILRPAYTSWWRKQQIIPEYLKFLSVYAIPPIIGFTPPETQTMPNLDAYGNVVDTSAVSPQQEMNLQLIELHNATAAAFPYGAEVKPLQVAGDGGAFIKALGQCDYQIGKAITTQSLATEEGQHASRAQASIHENVLDTLVRQGKLSVVHVLRRDVLTPWVAYNWGDTARHLVPKASLGETEQQDLPAMLTAFATAKRSGLIHDSQLPGIDKQLNLPPRDLTQDTAPPDNLPENPQTDPAAPDNGADTSPNQEAP